MNVKVDYINPFLSAAKSILKDVCQIEVEIGDPTMKEMNYEKDTVVIIVGITGEMKGQAMLCFDLEVGYEIASKMMMGMPVNELNDFSKSAISELSNMIMGNTATLLSKNNLSIDITPPTFCLGNMSISVNNAKNIAIPLTFDNDKLIEFNISIKDEKQKK